MSTTSTTPAAYFGNVKGTVQSFWHGLSVTLSHLLRRPMTVQYPDRTPLPVRETLPPRYRGFLEVDAAICTGCQACERACPIGCIAINLEKDATNPKQRVVTQFDIDEAKCMFCGLCVEPCPTGSIQHSREFEGSSRSVRNLVFRWADPANPFPVYKVDKNAAYYPRAPVGSLVRAMLEQRRWDAAGPQFLPPEPPKPAAAKPAPGANPAAAAKPAAKPAAAPAEGAVAPVKAAPATAVAVAPGAPPPSAPAVDAATIVAGAAKVAPAAKGVPAAAPEAAAPAEAIPAPKPPAGTTEA
jgi:NADH-quinone oxidoreductase subunit I/NAD(P)H-quinone oxidoreductase subunit I